MNREFKKYEVNLICRHEKGYSKLGHGKIQASSPCKAAELFIENTDTLVPCEVYVKCESGAIFKFSIGMPADS